MRQALFDGCGLFFVLMSLPLCRFVENSENIVFLDPPGVGKTHLTNAFGIVVAKNRYSTYYINLPYPHRETKEELLQKPTPRQTSYPNPMQGAHR